MSKLRVAAFSVSIDGYGAGPDQGLDNPLGAGGEALHAWLVGTRTFHEMIGQGGGEQGADDVWARRAMDNVGAWILGRNMFAPSRGDWPDDGWQGWWGDEPPYHCNVFVLTHHPRLSLEMQGGTVFHFETGGIQAALDKAKAAAGGKDVRVGGGVSTIRQYFQARLIDEAHLAIGNVLLGAGEPLFAGLDLPALGYRTTVFETTASAAHVVIERAQ